MIITGLGVGGAEKEVTSLADAYSALGHSVMIIVLSGDAMVLPDNSNVEVFFLNAKKKGINIIKSLLAARMLVRDFKPDVVHSHMVHANIFARLLRIFVKMPRLICTAHNTNEGGRLRMLAYRFTDNLADISTNVSKEAVESFIKKRASRPDKMIAVYNGIDTRKFLFEKEIRREKRKELQIADEKKVLLAVGRLVDAKDYPNLLRSFAKLHAEMDDCALLIAGDGPLRESLQRLAISLGIVENVYFLGIRQDIPALMNACDVFVLSSRYEGFGLVVAEAMACERIVVATDCGGVAEVVGNAGLLVLPNDSDALTEAISKALRMDDNARIRLGEEARKRIVESFSLDATVANWIRLYEKEGKLSYDTRRE